MNTRPFPRLSILAPLLLLLTALGGCSSYTVQGRVVRSDFGTLAFVPAGDARLGGQGVPSAEIKIYRDPTKPNMELIARTLSDADGSFSIPLDAFGAGFLVEQWRIQARRAGYQTVDMNMALPSAGDDRRLLIMLSPGISAPTRDDEDLMELYREFR